MFTRTALAAALFVVTCLVLNSAAPAQAADNRAAPTADAPAPPMPPTAASPSPKRAAVVGELQKLAAAPALKGLAYGICVADVASGEEIFAHDADAALIPASNMKLVTTAAALSTLGPDWRFRTLIGTLGNDLVIVGGGDPNLSGRFYNGDAVGAVRQWARTLKSRGVTNITGNLICDDALFESEFRQPNWPAKDIVHWYAAPVGALLVNDSCVDLHVAPSTAGAPAVVLLDPANSYFKITGAIMTQAHSKNLFGADIDPATHTMKLKGDVAPGNAEHVANCPVDDPGLFAAAVIRDALEGEGVHIAGSVVRKRVWTADWRMPAEFKLQLVHTSSLAQSIEVANTRSQNLYAECILKTLAAYADSTDRQWPSAQGSWARGQQCDARALEKLGVPVAGCTFDDGCGLSEHNRVTPRTFLSILVHMAKGPSAKIWMDSLAVAGESEGTLRRLRDARLKDRVFAKSGYITDARALSGYIKTDSGHLLAFSMLANKGPTHGMDHAAARTFFADALLAMLEY